MRGRQVLRTEVVGGESGGSCGTNTDGKRTQKLRQCFDFVRSRKTRTILKPSQRSIVSELLDIFHTSKHSSYSMLSKTGATSITAVKTYP